MTEALSIKWPREHFIQLQADGLINSKATYEEYLEMRRTQAERAEEARRLGLTGDQPPELTEEDEAILDRVWAEYACREREKLEAKWPRAQFEEFKVHGHTHPSDTYEEYLEMRREQEEVVEEGRRLGLTGDEPPELTEGDIAIFDRIWAEHGRKAVLKRKLKALRATFPLDQFQRLQAAGLVYSDLSYEQYLEMRLEQAETAEENGRLGRVGGLMEEEQLVHDRSRAKQETQVREERAA